MVQRLAFLSGFNLASAASPGFKLLVATGLLRR
jgi:hypothetical protein